MSIMKSKFNICDTVKLLSTNKIGAILKIIPGGRQHHYRVFIDGSPINALEEDLELVIDIEDLILKNINEGCYGNYNDFQLFQFWFRLSTPLENNLYSFLGSKTIFNPFQFKPLLRFLSPYSDERLFIADEVGVGKTIEAGIILKELFARNRLNPQKMNIILCPNVLGPKWENEMKSRFGFNFCYIHDNKRVEHIFKTYLNEGVPIENDRNIILGLQSLRQQKFIDLFEDYAEKNPLTQIFEMVIIDEAHHMRNGNTLSFKLGNILSELSSRLLMLSATPLNLAEPDLFNQMYILNKHLFPDYETFKTLQSPVKKLNKISNLLSEDFLMAKDRIIQVLEEIKNEAIGVAIFSHDGVKQFIQKLNNGAILTPEEIAKYRQIFISLSPLYYSFTRTRKREAMEHQIQREVFECPITFSSVETQIHNSLLDIIQEFQLCKGISPMALSLTMNIYKRMVSSSLPSAIEYIKGTIKNDQIWNLEPAELEDIEDDSEFDTVRFDPTVKVQLLEKIEKIEGIDFDDTKYACLLDFIKQTMQNESSQIIVFSFFVKTLEYIKKRLEVENYKIGIIHGKIPELSTPGFPSRYDIIESFKQGSFNILLSSEIGGEGLDFQFCHIIIKYDLPYNPMRIEQRIGRVDRFGQEADKILVANIFIKNTVDEEIYDRLYRRIHLIEDGVGVLEPILGKIIADLQNAIIAGTLNDAQKEEKTKRLERAIAEAKVQMETFETNKNILLGDDYLTIPIENLRSQGFLTPKDAFELTKECIEMWDNCTFLETGELTAKLQLSNQIMDQISQYSRKTGNEKSYVELNPLMSNNQWNAVFDGAIAESKKNHQFIPPTGYWMRFLTNFLKEQEKIKHVFSFGIDEKDIDLPAGEYLVFMYEIRISGYRTEIIFSGIPINYQSKQIIQVNFEDFPRKLLHLQAHPIQKPISINQEEMNTIAFQQIQLIIDSKKQQMTIENKYRIESRISALKNTMELRIKNQQEQIEKHTYNRKNENMEPEIKYIQLKERIIEKEKKNFEEIRNLMNIQMNISLSYNLQAVVYLNVLDFSFRS